MFVSFEGIDGSGKSTQARFLADKIRESGRETLLVREPGGGVLPERVRALLLDPSLDVDPMAELLLFSAARAQLVAETIRPALRRGAVVLCDRFFDSTVAYQGGGRGVFQTDWLESFQQHVTGGLLPDRTYLIATPVDVAVSRRSGREDDRMEASGIDFQRRVAEAYDALATRHTDRVLRLDGTQAPEALHAQIWADLGPRLADRPAAAPA